MKDVQFWIPYRIPVGGAEHECNELELQRYEACWSSCALITGLRPSVQRVDGGRLCCRVARAVSKQAPIEVLHVPELEAGFHFLYELKLEEAHTQFATWQKLHPTGPLGSASQAAGYLFEECYRQALSNSEHPIKVRGITRESDGCHR